MSRPRSSYAVPDLLVCARSNRCTWAAAQVEQRVSALMGSEFAVGAARGTDAAGVDFIDGPHLGGARLAVVSPRRWARTSASVLRAMGLPSFTPRALAALRAALVRALINARSFSAGAA